MARGKKKRDKKKAKEEKMIKQNGVRGEGWVSH